MEDSRQDLRTEFRTATESSGLAGFGLGSAVEGGEKMEGGGWRNEDPGRRTQERRERNWKGVGRVSHWDLRIAGAGKELSQRPKAKRQRSKPRRGAEVGRQSSRVDVGAVAL